MLYICLVNSKIIYYLFEVFYKRNVKKFLVVSSVANLMEIIYSIICFLVILAFSEVFQFQWFLNVNLCCYLHYVEIHFMGCGGTNLNVFCFRFWYRTYERNHGYLLTKAVVALSNSSKARHIEESYTIDRQLGTLRFSEVSWVLRVYLDYRGK